MPFDNYPELGGLIALIAVSILSASWAMLTRKDLLDPRVFFPLIYAFVTSSPCLFSIIFNEPYHPGMKIDVLPSVLYSCALGLIGFFIGASLVIERFRSITQLHTKANVHKVIQGSDIAMNRVARRMVAIAASLALSMYAINTVELMTVQAAHPGSPKSELFRYMSDQMLRNLRWSSALSSLLLALYVITDSISSTRIWSVSTLTLLPLYALLCVAGGERDFLLTSIMWLASNRKRVTRKAVVIVLLMIVILLGAIPVIRQRGLGLTALSETAQGTNAKDVSRSLMLLSTNLLVFSNVAVIVPDKESFWYGESLLKGALSFFPVESQYVEDTPTRWFANVYDRQGNAGLAFSQDAEAYLNFGWNGPPVWFAAWGWFLGCFYCRANTRPMRFIDVFLWWQSAVVGLFAIRADSRTPMKILVYGAIVAYVLHFIAAFVVSRSEASKVSIPQ